MPTTTTTPTSRSGTGQAPSPLAALETSRDTCLADLLTGLSGPVEGIELSPDYFYDWHNWGNK